MIHTWDGHQPSIGKQVFIAEGARVIGQVTLADGVSIWFGTVLRGDLDPISVGEDSNVQDLSVIHTDRGSPTVIGARVTVGHKAIVHGALVEDEALIGMGAILLTGAKVRKGAVVAAGALVSEGVEIPAHSLAVGIPARVVRELRPEERERARAGTESYCRQRDIYLRDGFGSSGR